ncbi:MAG TPA: hypothetical protein VL125_06400 [Pelobium sp.]|nr:hypothetical protein [Pelobium sp.]
MKTFITLLSSSVLLFVACNQNKPAGDTATATQDSAKNVKQCYQATVKTDSASLSYENVDGKVTGKLAFNFAEKDDSNGDITGYFSGDTLFVDYVFNAEGTVSKNPLVFLKSGNDLKQGYGEIESYLGKTYFKDHSQLKFEDGFLFKPVDCK